MSKLKLQVGKMYRTKSNTVVLIVSKHKEDILGFWKTYYKDASNTEYTKNGIIRQYGNNIVESLFDLVEEYIELENTPTGKVLYK